MEVLVNLKELFVSRNEESRKSQMIMMKSQMKLTIRTILNLRRRINKNNLNLLQNLVKKEKL
jgi:hypothetical protein